MKLWKHPENYAGATWEGWHVFLGRHRDSDELTESNFAVGLAAVQAAMNRELDCDGMPSVTVVRESHWAVGWVEWIAVHPSDVAACKVANELLASLEDYPVLNDEDFSRREDESAQQIWRNCYDVRERVEYIREHRSQFEFRDFADMLGCVRGKYFAGYASELIH